MVIKDHFRSNNNFFSELLDQKTNRYTMMLSLGLGILSIIGILGMSNLCEGARVRVIKFDNYNNFDYTNTTFSISNLSDGGIAFEFYCKFLKTVEMMMVRKLEYVVKETIFYSKFEGNHQDLIQFQRKSIWGGFDLEIEYL